MLSVPFPHTRQGLPCRNADTLKRLQETEKKLKEQQTKAYISMDISNSEREKGNQVGAPITLVNSTAVESNFGRCSWTHSGQETSKPGMASRAENVLCSQNNELSGNAQNSRYALELSCLSRFTATLGFSALPVNMLGFGHELRATLVASALHGLCSWDTVQCLFVTMRASFFTGLSTAIPCCSQATKSSALHCRPSKSRSTLKQSSTTQKCWHGLPQGEP